MLGYSPKTIKVDGLRLPNVLLRTNMQPEIGDEGYDAGAAILNNFFKQEIRQYLTPEIHPLGRAIIECCLNDGSISDYRKLIPIKW
ncbi:MAG: hypothetical protein BEN18_03605 [Epulopiscium sp. Nuni2H_MBin001]|nr:MAG: hypothetical protein BEN18_03605 [Epulopiscium sp. Nuni2H_MBin001]